MPIVNGPDGTRMIDPIPEATRTLLGFNLEDLNSLLREQELISDSGSRELFKLAGQVKPTVATGSVWGNLTISTQQEIIDASLKLGGL